MNCTEFHDLMHRRLDGEAVAENGELAAHAAACADCRAWQATLRRLEAGLHVLPRPMPPIHLADVIVAKVLADRRATRRRRFVVRAVLAAAAAVLVALLIGQRIGRQEPRGADGSDLVVVAPNPPQDRASERAGPSLRESVNGVAQLTLRSADETVKTFLPDTPPNNPRPSALTDSVASLREAGNSVATGLEPVADSAKRALNLFLREIPAPRGNEKRGS